MRSVFNYILTPVFYIAFGLVIVIFHPIQVIAFNVFGEMAHRKTVYFMNFLLYNSLRLLGCTIILKDAQKLPLNRTKIFVANHQSLHDIPALYWMLRKHHPTFVSKKELSTGIPSVSYNLRKSGAALINRTDRVQALKEILKMAAFIQDKKYSAVIFPEGTRYGKGLKRFKKGGVETFLRKAPNALIVPVVINGTRNLHLQKSYPLNTFQNLSWEILEPIESEGKSAETILDLCKSQIAQHLRVEK